MASVREEGRHEEMIDCKFSFIFHPRMAKNRMFVCVVEKNQRLEQEMYGKTEKRHTQVPTH